MSDKPKDGNKYFDFDQPQINLVNQELILTNCELSQMSENELIEIIRQRILDLLCHDRYLLLSICYRLDLDENKVRSFLADPDDPAYLLSLEIIEKIRSRNLWKARYKGQN
jgi:hypothetical protein